MIKKFSLKLWNSCHTHTFEKENKFIFAKLDFYGCGEKPAPPMHVGNEPFEFEK